MAKITLKDLVPGTLLQAKEIPGMWAVIKSVSHTPGRAAQITWEGVQTIKKCNKQIRRPWYGVSTLAGLARDYKITDFSPDLKAGDMVFFQAGLNNRVHQGVIASKHSFISRSKITHVFLIATKDKTYFAYEGKVWK